MAGLTKCCPNCNQELPVHRFSTDRSRTDGLARECRECDNARQRKWGRANPEKARAQKARAKIKLAADPERTERYKAKNRAYSKSNKNPRKKYKAKLLRQIFEHYGRECACCGETDPLFLTIDHINNDGAAHRREMGYKNGYRYTLASTDLHCWIRANGFPDTFQVLCFNCNCGKARNHGICPHRETRRQVWARSF